MTIVHWLFDWLNLYICDVQRARNGQRACECFHNKIHPKNHKSSTPSTIITHHPHDAATKALRLSPILVHGQHQTHHRVRWWWWKDQTPSTSPDDDELRDCQQTTTSDAVVNPIPSDTSQCQLWEAHPTTSKSSKWYKFYAYILILHPQLAVPLSVVTLVVF
jgi:hypothetical protein